VAIVLAVDAGSASEPDNRAGLAAVVANVLHEGTKTRSRDQLETAIEATGGDLQSVVTRDATLLTATVLADQLDAALALFADVVAQPAFAQAALDAERKHALDERAEAERDPAFAAAVAGARLLFKTHPYAQVAPTRESLAAITRDDLVRFHGERYRPGAAHLVLVGDVTPKQAQALARKRFGAWKAGKRPAPIAQPAAAADGTAKIHLVAPGAPSPEAAIRFAALGPKPTDADYLALVVAAQLVGGPQVRAGVDPLARGAVFSVETRGAGERASMLLGALLDDVARLIKAPPDASSLALAKARLAAELARALEDAPSVAHLVAQARDGGMALDAAARLARVDGAAVQAAAARWLDPRRAAIVVAGEKTLAPSLKRILPLQ